MEERPHVFFDLDGTLAERCGEIPTELVGALQALEERADVVIVTGAQYRKAMSQLNRYSPRSILTQNGNVWHEDMLETYRRDLPGRSELEDVWQHIFELMLAFEGGHVQHRGSQISYSPVGHDAPADIKKAWDPDGKVRRNSLYTHPFVSRDFVVSIGGTTCFDYMAADARKGDNVVRFAQKCGWNLDLCTYFGDALEPGGNDHSVVGRMRTIAVTSPADTLTKIL